MGKYNEKYFKMDDNMNFNKTEDVLEKGESILLKTKPKRSAYVWGSILGMLPLVLVWAAIDISIICFIPFESEMLWFLIPFFALHLAPVWIWLYNVITVSIRYKNLEYVFTEKRIIIRSGVIGIDFKSVYYSDIEGVNLKVGITDKIFKVGDIYIKAKTQSCTLYDVQNPYKLLSEIQKITLDIKTDIHYPNDLRPVENHGYNTKYVGKSDVASEEKPEENKIDENVKKEG